MKSCSGRGCQNEPTGQLLSLCISQVLQHGVCAFLIYSNKTCSLTRQQKVVVCKEQEQVVKSQQPCYTVRWYETEMDVMFLLESAFEAESYQTFQREGSSTLQMKS